MAGHDQANAAVDGALAAVSWPRYCRLPDGRQVPQTSRPALVAAMVRQLAPESGHCVFEVGTGSGYSTAVLAYAVGPAGMVVSIDVDEEPLSHARALLAADGYAHVELHHGDGRDWPSPDAGFDRVIAWAQLPSTVVPTRWAASLRPGGRAVLPMVENGHAIVATLARSATGIIEVARLGAGFIPLTSVPLRPWEH